MRDDGSGAGGMNPSPTHGGRFAVNVVGGGVPAAPRRGQDPSLRCKRYMSGNGKVEGRACPAPTDCHKWVVHERGKGGRQPAPLCSWRVVARERALTQDPSESPSHLTVTAPFDKGAFFPCGGSGEHPNFKTEEGSAALRTDSNTASV
mgnify:CR=1 FL=1